LINIQIYYHILAKIGCLVNVPSPEPLVPSHRHTPHRFRAVAFKGFGCFE